MTDADDSSDPAHRARMRELEAVRAAKVRARTIDTRRDAEPELIEIADTVTEMRMVEHAFTANIRAQKGIEF
jgi:cob(I)alamin adenosyltransferase